MKLSRSVKNLTDTKKHAAQNAHRYTVSLPLSKSFSIFLKTSQSKQKGQRKWKNIIMLGSAHLALLSLNGRENILVGISISLYYLYCCEVFFLHDCKSLEDHQRNFVTSWQPSCQHCILCSLPFRGLCLVLWISNRIR